MIFHLIVRPSPSRPSAGMPFCTYFQHILVRDGKLLTNFYANFEDEQA